MSARATFYLHKEDSDGNITLSRNVPIGDLSATKNGAPYNPTFVNNQNGTYYMPISGSGIYSIQLNGTTQDEFRDVYLADSDSLINTDVDGTSIQLNAQGKLELIDGDAILRQDDIIDTLTSTSIINPLSANQGRVISASIALKQDADTTVLREEDIINNFSVGGTDKAQGAQSLYLDLAGTTYLSEQTTYNGAMRELDTQLNQIVVGGTFRAYLPYGRSAALTSSMATQEMATLDGATNTRGYTVPRGGTISGLSISFNVTSWTKVGSQDDPEFIFDIYKNGSLISACQVEITVSSTGVKTASVTSPTAGVSTGDALTVKWRYQQGLLDLFSAQDVAILLEIRS